MKNVDINKNSAELSLIIRSLIKFIVIDGKQYVNEEKQIPYIQKYIYTLSKSINGHTSIVDMNKISRQIEKDLQRLSLE
jgi:hypothetical protein